MSNIQQVAEAFVAGRTAKCHNASTDGKTYKLHNSIIARKGDDGNVPGNVLADWCGFYTPTTASHLNAIGKALGASNRVGYAEARKLRTTTFFYKT